MSFRFCERQRRPSCGSAGYRPFERTPMADHSSPGALIMDAFRPEMLSSRVARQLRLLPRAFLHRAAFAPGLDQRVGALGCDRLDRVAGTQGGVRLTVRHVRAEAPFLEHDRLAADRVVAQLLERRSGRSAPALPGLCELGERLVQADREE